MGRRSLVLLLGLACLGNGFVPLAVAQELLPDVYLKVTYRQRTDGELGQAVHYVTFECSQGSCTLTTLTLNQCWEMEGKRVMFPKIERTSTQEETLSVSLLRDGVLTAEERRPGVVLKYRFEYAPCVQWCSTLTGFSGAVVKESDILDRVISWEMVPLKGKLSLAEVKTACDYFMLDELQE